MRVKYSYIKIYDKLNSINREKNFVLAIVSRRFVYNLSMNKSEVGISRRKLKRDSGERKKNCAVDRIIIKFIPSGKREKDLQMVCEELM